MPQKASLSCGIFFDDGPITAALLAFPHLSVNGICQIIDLAAYLGVRDLALLTPPVKGTVRYMQHIHHFRSVIIRTGQGMRAAFILPARRSVLGRLLIFFFLFISVGALVDAYFKIITFRFVPLTDLLTS